MTHWKIQYRQGDERWSKPKNIHEWHNDRSSKEYRYMTWWMIRITKHGNNSDTAPTWMHEKREGNQPTKWPLQLLIQPKFLYYNCIKLRAPRHSESLSISISTQTRKKLFMECYRRYCYIIMFHWWDYTHDKKLLNNCCKNGFPCSPWYLRSWPFF